MPKQKVNNWGRKSKEQEKAEILNYLEAFLEGAMSVEMKHATLPELAYVFTLFHQRPLKEK